MSDITCNNVHIWDNCKHVRSKSIQWTVVPAVSVAFVISSANTAWPKEKVPNLFCELSSAEMSIPYDPHAAEIILLVWFGKQTLGGLDLGSEI